MRNFIQAWRKHRGMTTVDLAERAGVSRTTLHQIEAGHRRYNESMLARLALPLGVSPIDLINSDPENPDPLVEALSGLTPQQTVQAIAIIKALKGAGDAS